VNDFDFHFCLKLLIGDFEAYHSALGVAKPYATDIRASSVDHPSKDEKRKALSIRKGSESLFCVS
jgi:hypothetical protein